jgi:ribulose-5-phosphate 4-epimerase/fuculose-1-phosphate aldolase
VNAPLETSRDALLELLARSCRILGKLDLTHGAFGHVSARISENSMLIKGKGPDEVGLRYTTPEDIIEVNFDGEKLAGPPGLQPPSECFLHSALLQKSAAVQSVIHIHPEHAVLLTICEKEILPLYGAFGPGARLAIDGVPVYPRSVTISSPELGDEFAACMGDKKAALLRGHGATVVGTGVEDATVRCFELNELVTMTYRAYLLGDPKPISDEDIAVIAARHDDLAPRPRGSAGGAAGVRAAFRYYARLAGEDGVTSA